MGAFDDILGNQTHAQAPAPAATSPFHDIVHGTSGGPFDDILHGAKRPVEKANALQRAAAGAFEMAKKVGGQVNAVLGAPERFVEGTLVGGVGRGAEAFMHPDQSDTVRHQAEAKLHVDRLKDQSANPNLLGKARNFAVDFATGTALDPLMYTPVGWVEKGLKGVGAAAKMVPGVERAAEAFPKTQLAQISRVSGPEKTVLKPEVVGQKSAMENAVSNRYETLGKKLKAVVEKHKDALDVPGNVHELPPEVRDVLDFMAYHPGTLEVRKAAVQDGFNPNKFYTQIGEKRPGVVLNDVTAYKPGYQPHTEVFHESDLPTSAELGPGQFRPLNKGRASYNFQQLEGDPETSLFERINARIDSGLNNARTAEQQRRLEHMVGASTGLIDQAIDRTEASLQTATDPGRKAALEQVLARQKAAREAVLEKRRAAYLPSALNDLETVTKPGKSGLGEMMAGAVGGKDLAFDLASHELGTADRAFPTGLGAQSGDTTIDRLSKAPDVGRALRKAGEAQKRQRIAERLATQAGRLAQRQNEGAAQVAVGLGKTVQNVGGKLGSAVEKAAGDRADAERRALLRANALQPSLMDAGRGVVSQVGKIAGEAASRPSEDRLRDLTQQFTDALQRGQGKAENQLGKSVSRARQYAQTVERLRDTVQQSADRLAQEARLKMDRAEAIAKTQGRADEIYNRINEVVMPAVLRDRVYEGPVKTGELSIAKKISEAMKDALFVNPVPHMKNIVSLMLTGPFPPGVGEMLLMRGAHIFAGGMPKAEFERMSRRLEDVGGVSNFFRDRDYALNDALKKIPVLKHLGKGYEVISRASHDALWKFDRAERIALLEYLDKSPKFRELPDYQKGSMINDVLFDYAHQSDLSKGLRAVGAPFPHWRLTNVPRQIRGAVQAPANVERVARAEETANSDMVEPGNRYRAEFATPIDEAARALNPATSGAYAVTTLGPLFRDLAEYGTNPEGLREAVQGGLPSEAAAVARMFVPGYSTFENLGGGRFPSNAPNLQRALMSVAGAYPLNDVSAFYREYNALRAAGYDDFHAKRLAAKYARPVR